MEWVKERLASILKGLNWAIDNGSIVNAWRDNWVGKNSLRTSLVGSITSQEEDLLVNEVLLGNGNLDLIKLSLMVPDHLIQPMKAIPTHAHWSS